MSHHGYKIKMLRRLKELGGRLEHVEAELGAEHSKDWEELAVEREGEEVLESLGAAGQAEIARILAALKRMTDGEYGYCVECGAEIAAERLNVLPETPLCHACASRHEAHRA
ncbi:TraR/DksA family transcriptional regulator [Mesobacterium sp. TK19101]|uniref:TraR/DksA family transcriptional regulator n=1 Tax=Mesobacterium hydrothermale TaxID=3111907 RepID=A0ABU6HEW0_9RHOB|nr:TraR/DksA family transcriptional regulator [Mesobacterium sp. TK19101]MEC3860380.1 TraR/DksA family transcriptional regulator [Mesobacterium sp. TK19101]